MTSGEASECGSIVAAPRRAEQKGCNDTWRDLAKLSVSSEPGNERLAMERVAEVVKGLGLSAQRLERLKTAVAEAKMPAKQLRASVYQVPGVAVTGSSCTRTSETTRDRALILKKDPQLGRGRDLRRSIALTKAQGWVEAANLRVTPRLIC
jgi:hypothetical protein